MQPGRVRVGEMGAPGALPHSTARARARARASRACVRGRPRSRVLNPACVFACRVCVCVFVRARARAVNRSSPLRQPRASGPAAGALTRSSVTASPVPRRAAAPRLKVTLS